MALRATKSNENGRERATIGPAESGRGRFRSGEVEAVRESDPDRAFGPIFESCLSARKGDSS